MTSPESIAMKIFRTKGLKIGLVIGLVIGGTAIFFVVRTRREVDRAHEEQEKPSATALPVVVAATPKEPSLGEQIQAKRTLQEAIDLTKPTMTDSANEVSPGSVFLMIWALKNMHWSDVSVTKDETSFALVQKDSDETRGKRLCAPGSIIEIATQKTEAGKYFEGLLMSDAMNLYHFAAVGSSGTLVAHSPARLCGVVIGKYDYSNSGGGVGHAIQVVGMFDLRENRVVAAPTTPASAKP